MIPNISTVNLRPPRVPLSAFASTSWWLVCATSGAAVVNQIGTYTNWPTTWTALGVYDGNNSGVNDSLDLVGDGTNPGLFYASDSSYVYLRMRVDVGTFTVGSGQDESHGAYCLLIDREGYGVSGIDYAFAWDTKLDVANHGLEMCVAARNGDIWSNSQLDDLDGTANSKGAVDINGSDRTTDGYVRTTDGDATTNFGGTTLIDFAVKWSYLNTNTNLGPGQSWKVAVATIDNATDHNNFNADVAGAELSSSTTSGWSSSFTTVPEPGNALAGLLIAAGLLRRRR